MLVLETENGPSNLCPMRFPNLLLRLVVRAVSSSEPASRGPGSTVAVPYGLREERPRCASSGRHTPRKGVPEGNYSNLVLHFCYRKLYDVMS